MAKRNNDTQMIFKPLNVNLMEKDEFEKLITTKLVEVKSKTGIRYTNLSSNTAISGKRESTQKTFLIDLEELYSAYRAYNLTKLKALKVKDLQKHGLSLAQSPAWGILHTIYEYEQEQLERQDNPLIRQCDIIIHTEKEKVNRHRRVKYNTIDFDVLVVTITENGKTRYFAILAEDLPRETDSIHFTYNSPNDIRWSPKNIENHVHEFHPKN